MIPFDLIIRNSQAIPFQELHFSEENKLAFEQILKEHKYIDTLKSYDLNITHKIMLYGHSGCGKTATAKALAHTLGKPIIITELSHLVSAKIGETSKQVKSLFDKANREKAILFLDEFDLIGKARSTDENDVGEMRRLVNTLLQLIDYLEPETIFIAATNFLDLIDSALLRRFELKIGFELPSDARLDTYYDQQLQRFPASLRNIPRKYSISYAEAKDYIAITMKNAIINDLEQQNSNIKQD